MLTRGSTVELFKTANVIAVVAVSAAIEIHTEHKNENSW